MANKSVNDPGSLGWTDDGNGFWSWSGDGDGSDCAGMVVSATEPTDPIEGMQWLNSDTAEVFIFDGAVWLEFPAGSGGSGGGLWEQNGNDIYYDKGNVSVSGSFTAGGASGAALGSFGVWRQNNSGLVFTSGSVRPATGAGTGDNSGTLSLGEAGYKFKEGHFAGDVRSDSRFVVSGGGNFRKHDDFGGLSIHGSGGVAISTNANAQDRLTIDAAGNVGIGVDPTTGTFDLSAKEQLKEWKTKAKKSSWPIVTDGAFEQEPSEDLVAQWIETRAAGDKLQVDGNISASGTVTSGDWSNTAGGARVTSNDGIFSKSPAFAHLTCYNGGIGSAFTVAEILKNGSANFSGSVGIGRPDTGVAKLRVQSTGKTAATYGLVVEDSDGTPTFTMLDNGNALFAGTVNGTRMTQDGTPVIDAKGLINTLSTLRNATKDETQDIRESLRSAIDELISGFEQQIATMPAPEPEASTMPAGDES